MDKLKANIAKYKYNREQRKEFWGSLAVAILLLIFGYMYFSIMPPL